jgi:hypothetical protein
MWGLRPLETQWGTEGEWVSGLATSGDLIFAALQIEHASEARADEAARRDADERERREAQARAVALRFSTYADQEGRIPHQVLRSEWWRLSDRQRLLTLAELRTKSGLLLNGGWHHALEGST